MGPNKRLILVLAQSLLIGAVWGQDYNYLFTANKLPDQAVRPTLANGNLGFVIYGDAVHMNGVYNGAGGVSHRARIPNYANIQINTCSGAEPSNCAFQLDMKANMFRTVYNEPTGYFRIVHDVYPHRHYDMVIVNKIRIQRLASQGPIVVAVSSFPGPPSVDITFNAPQVVDIRGQIYTRMCGRTNVVENTLYQTYGHDVCVHFQSLPQTLSLSEDTTAEEFFFYTAFTRTPVEAERELGDIHGFNPDLVQRMHTIEMDRIWAKYGITVEGNNDLDKVLKASSFYLSSSLRAAYTNQPSSYPFYGLSPSGLGRGGEELKEYQGHSFWDTEMWMYPPILLIDPVNAAKLLHYRSVVFRAAENNAKKNGYEGWQFPWESAFTGSEVTPECCPEVVEYQHHITADIAFAARQYYYATHDVTWLRTEGCRLAYESARFWASRAKYMNETDLYEIHNVMGPDEDHHDINNNAYTNVIAAHNLLFGEFAGCVCGGIVGALAQESARMAQIGRGMTLRYNEELDFHPQFDGYVIGTPIKQGDVVLLGYPLEYPMNISTKANNLRIYSQVTRSNGPAMTWAMHTIGHLDLEQIAEAAGMFSKSYSQYMRAPYNVWSENGDGTDGAGNFITGAGGFLQSVINGYAGVRLRDGELSITNPRVLPQTTRLFIPEINYMDVKFSLDITPQTTNITFLQFSTLRNVKVVIDGVDRSQETNEIYSATFQDKVTISPATQPALNGCKLRKTEIGIKVADQAEDSSMVHPVSHLLLILLALVSVFKVL
ncbi:protein-glucosylgalactosylhydroxylysine glucosidase-like [Uranotaenia lowii]|uniref:protein-glucosylgalactosylhydroxylysine glucosidase-like n=1 Tax=Uranotaenia lowii TaxID=190385 RepID=UPI00247AACE3|nr:protein-glucosylgalactosylhydroxylysine glucosidase-like [Uranotaenia lowii]